MPVVKWAEEKSENKTWSGTMKFYALLFGAFLFLWGMFALVSEYFHVRVQVEIGESKT